MYVTILGGTGKMGTLAGRVLERHGMKVAYVGRSTGAWKEKITAADVIIFSVPPEGFSGWVRRLSAVSFPHTPLLLDFSSYIGTHVADFKKISPRTGFIHMLFGPDLASISGEHIVASDNVDDPRFHLILRAFEQEKARIIRSSAVIHDRMMALIQALPQASLLALAKTLAESGAAKKQLEAFSTVTFAMNAAIISRMLKQPPGLWAGIQSENKQFFPLARHLQRNFNTFVRYATRNDQRSFAATYKKLQQFWKPRDEVDFVKAASRARRNITARSVGVLGPEGTYSHEALRIFDPSRSPIFYDTISDLLEAVRRNEIPASLLPFENSIHGAVMETLDGLYRMKLSIVQDIVLDIHHCLAGIGGAIPARERTLIYSYPQALAQCRAYLETHYPHARHILTPSTSAAFEKIKDEHLTNALAVGSRFAVELYGLEVIADRIEDKTTNQTLFVLVAKRPAHTRLPRPEPASADGGSPPYSLLVINPRHDRPGLLHDILTVFSQRNINLMKIESRPSQEWLGEYIFYLKAALPAGAPAFGVVLRELKKFGAITLLTPYGHPQKTKKRNR